MIIAEIGMKMPNNCSECCFYTDTPMGCWCRLVADRGEDDGKRRPSNCPLKEIGTCETCFHSTIDDDGDEVYCEKYCFIADSCNFHCSGWRVKND